MFQEYLFTRSCFSDCDLTLKHWIKHLAIVITAGWRLIVILYTDNSKEGTETFTLLQL